MKLPIQLLILTITLPMLCFSQTEVKSIDKIVKEIRDNLSTYKKVENIRSIDGRRFIYLNGKELRLITVTSSDSTIEKKVEWYYSDGQLCYAETNWLDAKTGHVIFNEMFYLHNRQLIEWKNSRDKLPDPTTDAFKKMEEDLVAYGNTIKDEALK